MKTIAYIAVTAGTLMMASAALAQQGGGGAGGGAGSGSGGGMDAGMYDTFRKDWQAANNAVPGGPNNPGGSTFPNGRAKYVVQQGCEGVRVIYNSAGEAIRYSCLPVRRR